jgi:hypothetical protein
MTSFLLSRKCLWIARRILYQDSNEQGKSVPVAHRHSRSIEHEVKSNAYCRVLTASIYQRNVF